MSDLPTLPGIRFARLGAGDTAELQHLFERCSDFFELTEGVATRPGLAAEELASRAPDRSDDETFCIGVYAGERLAGFAHLSCNYPKPREWWLALLVLDPADRGHGFGAAVHDALAGWIAARGGETLWLAVLAQNEPAQRFWTRTGYVERERQPYASATGLQTTAILMSLPLAKS